MKENLVDELHEADVLCFVLGSLISADSLVDYCACHKALNYLEGLKRDFEASTLKDDSELKSLFDIAESIIKRDIKQFEENNLTQNTPQ